MTLSYMVRKGDTPLRLARRFGINLPSLFAANPHLDPDGYLVPGQTLRLPERNAGYEVQPGDTAERIAGRFGLRPEELLAANPGVAAGGLRPGAELAIPASENGGGRAGPSGRRGQIDRDGRFAAPVCEYGPDDLTADLAELERTYPFLSVEPIGRSVLGKEIAAVKIGEDPREVHFNGAFHANEWITTPLLVKFLADAARSLREGTAFRGKDPAALFSRNSLWIVPTVNPDGVELVQEGVAPQHPFFDELVRWNGGSFDFRGWKANVRGVDLNDQFPAGWEIERERRAASGPGPRDWVGPATLSEPEARAVAEFTSRRKFALVIAFHTQGREHYWNYRGFEPPEAERIAERFARASGYRAVRLTDSDAGYKDWFIQEFRRPGFTVEAGSGTNPLPLSQFRDMYDEVADIMLEALAAE